MINKRVMSGRLNSGSDYFGLIVCGALFICGGIVGSAAAGFAGGTGVSDFMAEYLARTNGNAPRMGEFFSALFTACLYPFAAVFLGFSLLGVFCLPALAAVRGFFLCFSISAVVRSFGADGTLLALSIFGVNALLTIPCFFILSVQSFSASLKVLKGVTARGAGVMRPYDGGFFKRIGICTAVLACSALIDTLLVPRLIGLAAGRVL